MFDIITTTKNNIEWAEAFLSGMHNTLQDRNRRIIIADESNTHEHNQLISMSQKSDLNVLVIYGGSGRVSSYMLAAQMCRYNKVCVCDIDTCMLFPQWDGMIEGLLQEHEIIAVAPRYQKFAEAWFLVMDRDLFVKANMAGFRAIKEWDSGLLEDPHIRGLENECVSITYHAVHAGHNMLLWTNRVRRTDRDSRWGDIIVVGGEELVYHNYYAGRCKIDDDVPFEEFFICKKRIMNTPYNAKALAKYFTEVWPGSLNEYLDSYDGPDVFKKVKI